MSQQTPHCAIPRAIFDEGEGAMVSFLVKEATKFLNNPSFMIKGALIGWGMPDDLVLLVSHTNGDELFTLTIVSRYRHPGPNIHCDFREGGLSEWYNSIYYDQKTNGIRHAIYSETYSDPAYWQTHYDEEQYSGWSAVN